MGGMASKIGSHLEQKAEDSIVEVFDKLLGKIYNLVTDECSLLLSLEVELEFLRKIHPDLMEVVVNVEVKRESDLLMALKKFYYDGKDIVEEFDTEVARRKLNRHLSDLEMEGQQSCTAKMGLRLKVLAIRLFGEQNFKDISLFLKPLCGCFFPGGQFLLLLHFKMGNKNHIRSGSSMLVFSDDFSFFFFRRNIAIKIRDLYGELQKIKSLTDRIANFRNDVMGGLQHMHVARGGSMERRKVVDHILASDFLLVGRDDAEKEVKDLLLNKPEVTASSSSGSSTSIPCVLVIWGMGGIGKTTLVQAIYNDPDVEEHFEELKQWVCVGDDELDPDKVMEKIIKKGTNESQGDTNREKVLSIVKGKRFLIILDDVWKGEHLRIRWEELSDPLSHGAEGSWIIITTRDQDVKNQMGSRPRMHKQLNRLGDEECFQIFQRYAFPPTVAAASSSSSTSYNIPENLRDIAMRIVREKIKGIPLAAKVLGSSLENEPEEFLWQQAFDGIKDNDIRSTLMWSYRRLPTRLKQCFAYFSVYPKDRVILEDEIIYEWAAFGYIQSETVILEDVGRMYLRDLVRASLLEPQQHDVGSYKIHDLIHDLAMDVSDLEKESDGDLHYTHLGKLWRLETLDYSDVNTFHGKLQTVRMLCIERVPSDWPIFSDLIHLRILDLRYVDSFHSLPESLCDLYNLHILHLPKYMKKLPEAMWKLVNLCHIYGGDDAINFARVHEVGKLTSLQTMSQWGNFGLYKNGGKCITQLKDMKQLRTCLNISGLCHVTNIQWARDAELENKVHLERLILDMEEDEEVIQVSEIELFDSLKPHKNLENLEIKHYKGVELPMWMRNLLNIVSLTLSECYGLKRLPPLGHLDKLRKLKFIGLKTIERINAEEVYGTDSGGGKTLYPSLRELYLKDMAALEEWEEPIIPDNNNKGMINCFPLLEELVIMRCNKLRCLPTISSIKELRFFVDSIRVQCDVVKWLNQMSSSLSKVSLSIVGSDAEFTFGCHFGKLAHLEIEHMFNLRSLDIRGLPLLESLDVLSCEHLERMLLSNLPLLESLRVRRCEHLERMLLSSLPSLKDLCVYNCCAIKVNRGSQDLSAVEFAGMWRCEVNDESNQLYVLQNLGKLKTDSWEIIRAVDPHSLQYLKLVNLDFGLELCSDDQKWLVSWLQNLSSVERLSTDSWHILRAIDPHGLRYLKLCDLDFGLEMCSDDPKWWMSWFQNLSSIAGICIMCPKVRGGAFPSFLELRNLHSLQKFEIETCPELQALPELPSSIKKSQIIILGCPLLRRREM